ncbi:MAG TPA: tetratricopeptide repeat protein [Pyrinomonadaceae bacterium]|nr:tetratricopeptide repeat protein [Pyrinomonadaceae bacterium]
MTETEQLLTLRKQLEDPGLEDEQRVLVRCSLSKRLVLIGDFEGAVEALGDYWLEGGRRPPLAGLSESAKAELLLRVGVLIGWLGSVKQVGQTQERAKNFIGESLSLFETLGDAEKAAEAQTELGYCYWREGGLDEARVLTREALRRLGEDAGELRGWALVRCALIELTAFRLNDALLLLNEASSLYARSEDHPLLGRFHQTFGNTLQLLGVAERRQELVDQALLEYTAAGFHFEQAGDMPNVARTENNVGYLLQRLNRFKEAHEHFDRATALFRSLGDGASVAQVDDSRAQCLLAEGRHAEAERMSRRAAAALERGDEQSCLAEALITLGTALARLRRPDESREALERAKRVGELAGDIEAAGRACLSLIEELGERLDTRTLRDIYVAADAALAKTQYIETSDRLRRAARSIFEAHRARERDGEKAPHVKETTAGESHREASLNAGASTVSLIEGRAHTSAEGIIAAARETCPGSGVVFTPKAVDALNSALDADDSLVEVRRLVERTLAKGGGEEIVGADAVRVVMLRRKNSGAGDYDFARPWTGFSIKTETRLFERPFIELALRTAGGKVSQAATLLGFAQANQLNSLMKTKHPDLMEVRKPIISRRRGIMNKVGVRRKKKPS